MQMISMVSAAVIGIYILLLLLWVWSWKSLKSYPVMLGFEPRVSVVVVFRNEAERLPILLQSIDNQQYNKDKLELILYDDGSDDDSYAIVKKYMTISKLHIILERGQEAQGLSPKKRHLKQAINQACGEIILSTDADCHVGPHWVASMVAAFEQESIKLVSGPVTFDSQWAVFNQLQIVELASLVGSGGSAIYQKMPNMCNGANLAYRKAVFFEVGGFEGNEAVASGDDEFLMHKIFGKYPQGLAFQKSKLAIVHTLAHTQAGTFVQQRIRWASKWPHYQFWYIKALAWFVAILQVALLQLVISAILQNKFDGFFVVLLLKLLVEAYFLVDILKFLGKIKSVIFIPLAQICYPIYVILIGILSFRKSYTWKGRSYKV
jgi:cellulose synthase/poly-beta-1,6-N-acetylglucosamine synthase-like glycosyltransferase